MRRVCKILFILISLHPLNHKLEAQNIPKDTTLENVDKQEVFYDSLEYKASQKKFTSFLYNFLISPPRPYVDKKAMSLNYYSQFEGKLISEINIKSLNVFGPSFKDTTRKSENWLGRTANKIHTKSNLNSLQKLLLFKVGDIVDPELIYENERIIRSLPYIKDVQLIFEQDSIYGGLVNVTLLTQDRFSFGVSGAIDGLEVAALQVYNKNIFGIGHELSIGFLGNINEPPYLGLETYYRINNIRGKFINISVGYLNTYRNEGFKFVFNKPFITPSMKWGYGAQASRLYRTNRISDDDPIVTISPLNLSFYSAWAGRSFQLNPDGEKNTQMVLSLGFKNQNYFDRTVPETNTRYFSNRTLYLTGITFSQRRFVQDQLVFSYGITEDIPEGFKNEIVYGFDANEFGNRHYAHLLLSNGNLLTNRKGYLNIASGIGGYFNKKRFEQGEINGTISFISKQINFGRKKSRLYSRADYTLGIRRFEIENLNLGTDNHIRGFYSRDQKAIGKQRLSLNLEYVLFLQRDFYKFNMAVYGFTDMGVIGSNNEFILSQNYYSGIGMGIRLHNENLVFKTFQLRLAFYPFHPSDMEFVGFILDEQLKRKFYSFEPTAPEPFRFR